MKQVRKIQKAPKCGTLTSKQCRDAVKAVMAKRAKKDIVQIKNPTTGLYCKIDRATGTIISNKKSPGQYKNVKVIRNKFKKRKQKAKRGYLNVK